MMERMNKSRKNLKLAIAINALVVVLEVWAAVNGIARRGAESFMYYTALSNMFGCVACLVCLICEVKTLRAGAPLPRYVRWIKFSAACCLLMTLFVVVFVLAPAYYSIDMPGFYLLFCVRELPITHLVGPLLVFGSYILFEADRDMTLRQSLVGFVPTVMYAAVAYPCNIAQLWHGPYPFFYVWEMPVWQSVLWFIALCVLAIALCQLPRLLGRRFSREP